MDPSERVRALLERYLEERLLRGSSPDPGDLCGAEPELLEPLLELIGHYEAADRELARLGTPERPEGSGEGRERPEPPEIADYRLHERLGEGGMGEVWVADQLSPVRRRVAVKILKGGGDSQQVAARFEAESQALAQMEHPNIAKVLDAGVTEGNRPYFAMELVSGLPITAYCDRYALTTDERIELMIQVCTAVHHAHQRGIIHRDLKPSNILVAADGEAVAPKIIDFGIAKATRPLSGTTPVTQQGQFLGTPAYMSPEQADPFEQDIDSRADVYSLGVILYELLVGVRPWSRPERTPLGSTDPVSPSARLSGLSDGRRVAERRRTTAPLLARRLRGDLDWIILKALSTERSRRYGSATELGADLRRHLRHEPVMAGPPGARYRLEKFARRHRAAVAVGALLVLGVAGGVAGLAIGLSRAVRAERSARLEAETAREVADFVIDLFEVSDPGTAQGETLTARNILEQGRRRIESDLRERPLVRARLMTTIGEIHRKLGLYEEGLAPLEEALEIRRGQLGEDHPEVGQSLRALGEMFVDSGDDARASPLLERAQGIFELSGEPDQEAAVRALNLLGGIAFRAGELDEAERLYERCLASAQRLPEPGRGLAVAEAWNGLGTVLGNSGRLDEAEAAFRRAAEEREAALGPGHPSVANSLVNLAMILSRLGRDEEGGPLLRRALKINETALGPGHRDVFWGHLNLSVLLGRQGKTPEAIAALEKALLLGEEIFGADHFQLAPVHMNLGALHQLSADYDRGEAHLLRALEIIRTAHGDEHHMALWTLNRLGNLYRQQARYDVAREHHRLALDTAERTQGGGNVQGGSARRGLARVALAQGRLEEAEGEARRALEAYEAAAGAESPETAITLVLLGDVLLAAGRSTEAGELQQRALDIRERSLEPGHPSLAQSLSRLGEVARQRGDLEAAEELYRRGLSISEAAVGADHPDVAAALQGLGRVLVGRGEREAARPLLERCLKIREATVGTEHPETATAAGHLAALLADLGEVDEAQRLVESSLRILEARSGPRHAALAGPLTTLCRLERHRGRLDRAERYCADALEVRQQSLASGHPLLAESLEEHAGLLRTMGRTAESEALMARAQRVRQHPIE